MSLKTEDFWDTETITITRKDLEEVIAKESKNAIKNTKDVMSGAMATAVGFRIMMALFDEKNGEEKANEVKM